MLCCWLCHLKLRRVTLVGQHRLSAAMERVEDMRSFRLDPSHIPMNNSNASIDQSDGVDTRLLVAAFWNRLLLFQLSVGHVLDVVVVATIDTCSKCDVRFCIDKLFQVHNAANNLETYLHVWRVEPWATSSRALNAIENIAVTSMHINLNHVLQSSQRVDANYHANSADKGSTTVASNESSPTCSPNASNNTPTKSSMLNSLLSLPAKLISRSAFHNNARVHPDHDLANSGSSANAQPNSHENILDTSGALPSTVTDYRMLVGTVYLHEADVQMRRHIVPILAVLFAAFQPPSLSLLAAALDRNEHGVHTILHSPALSRLIYKSNNGATTIIVHLNDEGQRWKMDCTDRSSRNVGRRFWIDVGVGHNQLCALYLKCCGNKSVAIGETPTFHVIFSRIATTKQNIRYLITTNVFNQSIRGSSTCARTVQRICDVRRVVSVY